MNKRIPIYLPALVFLITTVVFFYDQIFGNFFFWEDFLEYIYPVQTLAARDGGLFNIPFWNPYIFGGMPFFADLQAGFLYPLNRILGLFVDSSGNLSVAALQMQIILHFFIAQFSMFFLLRYLKISDIGSIISSISYGFSFILVMHVIHPMMLFHLAWFPIVLMFTLRSIDKNSLRSGIIAGLILGGSMLAGHPQTTIYQYLFIGIMILFKLYEKFKDKANITKPIIGSVFVFVFSIGLFFIQYLPSQDLADYSQREEITYEKSSEGSLEFKQIITSVIPNFFGQVDGMNKTKNQWHLTSGEKNVPYYHYWDTGYFFGLTVLILGIFGALYYYKKPFGIFLISITLFGFLYALGDNGFLHKMFYNLPFFSSLRIPARMMFFAVIGFSILAGFGYDKLTSDEKDIKKLIIALAFPILIGIMGVTGVLQSFMNTPDNLTKYVNEASVTSFIYVLLISLVLVVGYFKVLHTYIVAILLVVLTFFNLYSEGSGFNKSVRNPEDVYKLPEKVLTAFQVNPPNKIFRVKSRIYKPRYMAFQRNQGMVSKMMLMEGYNPLLLQRIYPANSTSEVSYDLLNINYVVDVNMQTGQPYFKDYFDKTQNVWMVYNKVVHQSDDMKKFINDSGIDFSKTVVLENEDNFNIPMNDTTNYEYSAKISSYKNDEIIIEIDSPEKGYLVLSEIWYPDWKAEINGKETEVLRADNSLRALPVEKGKSEIKMYYESDSFKTGRIIAIITLLAGVVGIFIFKDQNKK